MVVPPASASLLLKTPALWSSRLIFGRLQRNTNQQQGGLSKMQGATQLLRNQLSALAAMMIVNNDNKPFGRNARLPACLQQNPLLSRRKRGQPYFLYIALAHMHVPLAPPPPAARHADASDVYAASLREMDTMIGAVKSASDETDRENTLIWFTG